MPAGDAITPTSGVLFVDGVRRIDGRAWIDDAAEDSGPAGDRAVAGICASYAAGVVCFCERGAHVTAADSIEAAPTLDQCEAVALANMTQQLLGRSASVEYEDGWAPQNLVPIARLEKDLQHRLGYAPVVYRELRSSAVS